MWNESFFSAPQLKRDSLGGITLDSRPRWFILSSTLLAIFALSFFGRFYHQWLIGIGAAIAIIVVSNLLCSLIQSRVSKPPRRPVYEQAVIVRLSPPQRGPSTEPEEDLWTLETLLTDVIERQGLGEYDGDEVGEDGATTCFEVWRPPYGHHHFARTRACRFGRVRLALPIEKCVCDAA